MTTRHYVPGGREQQSSYTKFVCVPQPQLAVKGHQVQRLCQRRLLTVWLALYKVFRSIRKSTYVTICLKN